MNYAGACKATKKFKDVTHVIFDMDGVLLDTERFYTEVSQKIVNKYGKTFDWSIKAQLMGLHGPDSAKKIVELLDLPITAEEYYDLALEDIAKQFGKIYTPQIQGKVIGTVERESARIAVTEMALPMSVDMFQYEFRTRAHRYLNNVPLMTGAEKIIKHLHSHKIPIAVATSSSQESFDLKTTKHKELFGLFNHIVCGGSDPEVKEGKPKPDIFLICASRFVNAPKAEKCLVFEDAPNGVTAANNAGMQVVMVPDENVPENLLEGADVVVHSLEDVRLELFGLPPFSNK